MSSIGHVEQPRTGRRPGDSGTRQAILTAACRHFADYGYDRASLRAIAEEAHVDHKLISHFFGSKQKLFVAAIDLPLDPAEILSMVLGGDPAAMVERLTNLLVTVMEQPKIHQRLTSVMRAAACEPQVAAMVRQFLTRELFAPAAKLLGGEEGPYRVNLVGSQLVGLIITRYVIQIEPLASMEPTQVAAAIAPTLHRYLTCPLPNGQ